MGRMDTGVPSRRLTASDSFASIFDRIRPLLSGQIVLVPKGLFLTIHSFLSP
jgi:hypothetical protein